MLKNRRFGSEFKPISEATADKRHQHISPTGGLSYRGESELVKVVARVGHRMSGAEEEKQIED